jgi:hypothetical protein
MTVEIRRGKEFKGFLELLGSWNKNKRKKV